MLSHERFILGHIRDDEDGIAVPKIQWYLIRRNLVTFATASVQAVHQLLDRQLKCFLLLFQFQLGVLDDRASGQKLLVDLLQTIIGRGQLTQQLLTSL